MIPTSINLQEAQTILTQIVEQDNFNAVEITFRFINGKTENNGNGDKAEGNGNGNGRGNNGSIVFPEEFIVQLNTAKTVKQLFYLYYQYEKELDHYSLADKNKVKTALNVKKEALQKVGR